MRAENGLFEIYQIDETQSIAQAFAKIDANQSKAIFVRNSQGKIVGVASDGDIRRWLLKHPDMNTPIAACMNREFVYVLADTPREKILKLLDHRISIIPRLDAEKCLLEVITRQSFPLALAQRVFARAKSPVRVSFGGGGTDLTQYFYQEGGAVMNATVRIYSHATLRKRSDSVIEIYSHDLKQTLRAGSLSELLQTRGAMDLVRSLLQLIAPDFGFELQIGSEFPVGSGLGGSAVVLSAVIGCFNEFREDHWDNYEIAEMAFQAERLFLNMAGGWQDQYATVFGGFNFMEFNKDNNIVHPLRIQPDYISELEQSLILCYSGNQHSSGSIHEDQKKQMRDRADVQDLVHKNKELTYQMKTLLLRGKLLEFGRALDQAWQLKRHFSSKISNSHLDNIYDLAKENGAVGGKLLGAGGGGYFLFYVEPFKKYKLTAALEAHGYTIRPVQFEEEGLQSWTVRESDSLGAQP